MKNSTFEITTNMSRTKFFIVETNRTNTKRIIHAMYSNEDKAKIKLKLFRE
jgi:hypothetical protein